MTDQPGRWLRRWPRRRPGRWLRRLLSRWPRRWPRPRPWRHWTVRMRMVLTVAALAAVALLVADFAGSALLRTYLVGRVDDQLRGRVRILERGSVINESRAGRLGPGFGPDSRTYVFTAGGEQLSATGRQDARQVVTGPAPSQAATRPPAAPEPYAVTAAEADNPNLGGFAQVKAHAGSGPYTVSGSIGPWRVMVTELRSRDGYVVDAVSMREIEATQRQLIAIDTGVTTLVLVCLAFAAAAVVGMGLRPLTRMAQTATGLSVGEASGRIAETNPHTEPGRLGIALNTMLGRFEEALRARTASEAKLRQFLADASHELRTPLTSIQGFAELYRRGGLSTAEELGEAMARVEGEVARMRLLVNDLLLLARLDEERPLERARVDLLAVAADAVRDAHVRVPSRFVELAGFGQDEDCFEPVTVCGDEPRLRQVVTNLVTNALQHTPDGCAIVVRVGVYHRAEDDREPAAAVGDELPPDAPIGVIEVADSGPGLSEADATRVFERLYRADPSRSRRHGGAGLGLSIVAAIVSAHGGRVELFSSPGLGARFRVYLPADPAED